MFSFRLTQYRAIQIGVEGREKAEPDRRKAKERMVNFASQILNVSVFD